MKFAIIAAGEGERLKSRGIDTPKPLVKINGVCLIDRAINLAAVNRFDEVYCIVNEYFPEVANHLLSTNYGIKVNVIIKTTLSSLHSLYELCEFLDRPFVLSTVDSVYKENDFISFIRYINESGHLFDSLLGITDYIDDEKPLCVELDDKYRILSFHNEKNNHQWATGGIYYFRTSIQKDLEDAVSSGVQRLRNFFNILLKKGYYLEGFKFSKIIDVDHPEDVIKAEEFLGNQE